MTTFFPLKQNFGGSWADDPDDANLVDRALRRVGVMPKPVYGSTNPVPDIQAGLQRFQRDSKLAVDGFMRTQGPTSAKLAERLDEALKTPSPNEAGNPWPWGSVAAAVSTSHGTAVPRVTLPRVPAPRPEPIEKTGMRAVVRAKAVLDGRKAPHPLPKPPAAPILPDPVSPAESRRIAQAVQIVQDQSRPDTRPDHGVPFGDTQPVPGRKPDAPKKPELNLLPPVDQPMIRNDPAGDGKFGASRDGGTRTHKGIDILAEPGTEVRAPISGVVQIGNVYGENHHLHGQFDSIWITGPDGTRVKFFYVDGSKLVDGQHISAGQVVGAMQDRAMHSKGMQNHLHVEIHRNGKPIDPTPLVGGWFGNNKSKK